MLSNREKIGRLKAEYADVLKREKAGLAQKKEALMKAATRQNKLLEKQAEAAIVKIVRQGIFPRMKLTGLPAADEVVRLENKAIDARFHVIIERVQAGDKLGSLKALKVELDAAIMHLEKGE